MRRPRMRLTVFRLLLAIAVAALILQIVTEPLRVRARQRRERCLTLATWHAQSAKAYRNGRGAMMLRTAAWHEYMAREHERAAEFPDLPMPESQPAPPAGWVPPDEVKGKW